MLMSRIFLNNAGVLDGTMPIQTGFTVVVDKGRITSFCPVAEAPPPTSEDEVYDLSGKTLMPGMVSSHFHAPYHNVGGEMGGLPTQEHPPGLTAYRALANVQKALNAGFTSVVSAGCTYDLDAQLETAINMGLVEGPRIVPCGRDTLSSADNAIPWWIDVRSELGINRCDGPEEMRKMVRREINRGARLIKLTASGGHAVPQAKGTRMFSNEEIRAAVEAAHDRGARVRTHVAGKAAILDCIACGVDILDHCDDMDDECIDAMLEADVFVIPSIYQTQKLFGTAGFYGSPTKELEAEFRWMCEILPKAAEAGVKLCVGDDYGTFATQHGEYAEELKVLVDKAGLTQLEVIKWATRNGGLLTGFGNLGVIAQGNHADLLVIDGDPSQDISLFTDETNITAIMLRGEFYKNGLNTTGSQS
jgi:imidazolonepropionase-like amidohydrolase